MSSPVRSASSRLRISDLLNNDADDVPSASQRRTPIGNIPRSGSQAPVTAPQLEGLSQPHAASQQTTRVAAAHATGPSNIAAPEPADPASTSLSDPYVRSAPSINGVQPTTSPVGWAASYIGDSRRTKTKSFSSNTYGDPRALWFAIHWSLGKRARSVKNYKGVYKILDHLQKIPAVFRVEPYIALARRIKDLPEGGREPALARLRTDAGQLATPGALIDSLFAGKEDVFVGACNATELRERKRDLLNTFVTKSVLKEIEGTLPRSNEPEFVIYHRVEELDRSIQVAGGDPILRFSASFGHLQAGQYEEAALEKAASSPYRGAVKILVEQAENVKTGHSCRLLLEDIVTVPPALQNPPLTALAYRIPYLPGDKERAFKEWLNVAGRLHKRSDELDALVVAGSAEGIGGLIRLARSQRAGAQ